jgi:hypothetical protein
MQKWEYKTVKLKDKPVRMWLKDYELDELGSDGWELTTVLYSENDFKGLRSGFPCAA